MVGTRTGTDGPLAHGRAVTVTRNWLRSSTALSGWAAALPIAVIGAGLIGMTPAHANPEGGNVVAGTATIDDSISKTLTIRQKTNKAVINWTSFSIGLDETTHFIQPSSSSIVLNRVTGDTTSAILGRLTANGQVMLLNPNGILFGANSRIDVASLVATTHDIDNNDFLAGNIENAGNLLSHDLFHYTNSVVNMYGIDSHTRIAFNIDAFPKLHLFNQVGNQHVLLTWSVQEKKTKNRNRE